MATVELERYSSDQAQAGLTIIPLQSISLIHADDNGGWVYIYGDSKYSYRATPEQVAFITAQWNGGGASEWVADHFHKGQHVGTVAYTPPAAPTYPNHPDNGDEPRDYGVTEIMQEFPEFTADFLRPFARPTGWGYAIPEPISQQTALAVEIGLIYRLKPDLLNPDQAGFGRYRLTIKGRGVLSALIQKALEDGDKVAPAEPAPKPVAVNRADLVVAVRRMCERNGGVNESSLYQFVIEVMREQKPKTTDDLIKPMLDMLQAIRDGLTGDFTPSDIARDALDYYHDVMKESK